MKRLIPFIAVIALTVVSCTKKEERIEVKSIEITPDNVTIHEEETFSLTATVLPENATDKSLVWASNNTSIATVSPEGVVTGISEGSTNVTASSANGSAMSGCRVEVLKKDQPISVVSVSLDKASLDMYLQDTYTLTATITPSNATDKAVSWTSSNPSVASVSDKGVVTATAAGKTDITVTTHDGAKAATCSVSVTRRQPKRPSAGGNWTVTDVTDGVVLYHFYGNDSYSGKNQNVFVADVDPAKYALRFFYDGNRHIPSEVFNKRINGPVLINAAYEMTSVFIRVDGVTRAKTMDACINGTDVPNWKNDGGIHVDEAGNLTFSNSIFRKPDSKGTGSYGLSLEEQRTYYRSDASNHYGTYSSAPLLVMDYDASFGLGFVPDNVSWKSLNSEHPYRHQANTHPRTAVATDCDGHILLIVADGRYDQAVGFPAKNLTQFLVGHFDVRNALNLDGGGSTCMCVEGLGDPDTHVVNHPCDHGSWDSPGERTLSTFIWIEKRK